jgi:hypothetical protein
MLANDRAAAINKVGTLTFAGDFILRWGIRFDIGHLHLTIDHLRQSL